MSKNGSAHHPTANSVAAGLMIDRDIEALRTDAGLLAAAVAMACGHSIDDEGMASCMSGILRALSEAVDGGFSGFEAKTVLRAIEAGIDPSDGTEGGNALAELCFCTAYFVGSGRMRNLIEGRKVH